MSSLRLSEEHGAAGADVALVVEGLRGFNDRHRPSGEPKPLNVFLQGEDDRVLGGLLGATRWHRLLVEILWVEDGERGRGLGRALLDRAEGIARERGCRRARLDPAEFQARGFYERAGYRVFGELADDPPGSRTFYLEKPLVPPGAGR